MPQYSFQAFASPSECLPPHETSMTRAAVRRYRPRPNPLLFRVAFARARPCYCYGCICLTPEERAYERRVFKIAHAWGKQLRDERRRQALPAV